MNINQVMVLITITLLAVVSQGALRLPTARQKIGVFLTILAVIGLVVLSRVLRLKI